MQMGHPVLQQIGASMYTNTIWSGAGVIRIINLSLFHIFITEILSGDTLGEILDDISEALGALP